MPTGAADVALVAPHDAHAAEPDLRVGADGRRVRCGGVDRDPVVATVFDQVAHEPSHRLRAEAATMQGRIQEQIDARMAVLGVELLGELDQPSDCAIDLDRQAR
jgi:hypothetical protein